MVYSAPDDDYCRFRVLLADARRSQGITQVELARRLGKPQSFVSKYERGERRLDVVEFLDIAQAMNIEALGFLRDFQQQSHRRKRSPL